MARGGINKVILIGNLGQDPEVRYMPNGNAVANISIATSESWRDKNTGEQKEMTEWHRVVLYRRLAEVAGEYLKKGAKVYIEGKLRTRKWQAPKSKPMRCKCWIPVAAWAHRRANHKAVGVNHSSHKTKGLLHSSPKVTTAMPQRKAVTPTIPRMRHQRITPVSVALSHQWILMTTFRSSNYLRPSFVKFDYLN